MVEDGEKPMLDSAGKVFRSSETVIQHRLIKKSLKDKLICWLECDTFHYVIIILILFDLVILMTQQVLELHHLEGYLKNGKGLKIAHEALFITSCFILALLVLEILLKIILFKSAFLKNIMNLMDAIVILFSLPFEVYLHLFHNSIGQIAAPIIIVFRFWKVIRGIHAIAHSVEVKNQVIIQRIEREKESAMLRINNYQAMIYDLSNQLIEKEESNQGFKYESEKLAKKMRRITRELNSYRFMSANMNACNSTIDKGTKEEDSKVQKDEDSANSSCKTIKLSPKGSHYSSSNLEKDQLSDESNDEMIYTNGENIFNISPEIISANLANDSIKQPLNKKSIRRLRGSQCLSMELMNNENDYIYEQSKGRPKSAPKGIYKRSSARKETKSNTAYEKRKTYALNIKNIKLTPSRENIYNIIKNDQYMNLNKNMKNDLNLKLRKSVPISQPINNLRASLKLSPSIKKLKEVVYYGLNSSNNEQRKDLSNRNNSFITKESSSVLTNKSDYLKNNSQNTNVGIRGLEEGSVMENQKAEDTYSLLAHDENSAKFRADSKVIKEHVVHDTDARRGYLHDCTQLTKVGKDKVGQDNILIESGSTDAPAINRNTKSNVKQIKTVQGSKSSRNGKKYVKYAIRKARINREIKNADNMSSSFSSSEHEGSTILPPAPILLGRIGTKKNSIPKPNKALVKKVIVEESKKELDEINRLNVEIKELQKRLNRINQPKKNENLNLQVIQNPQSSNLKSTTEMKENENKNFERNNRERISIMDNFNEELEVRRNDKEINSHGKIATLGTSLNEDKVKSDLKKYVTYYDFTAPPEFISTDIQFKSAKSQSARYPKFK